MRKHAFRPSLNDVLEDRIALSHIGGVGVVHVAHAHPTPAPKGHPVLKSAVLNDANHKIDVAFAQFTKEYNKEITKVDRTGNEAKFQSDLGASVNRLRSTLAKQAARIPGGSTSLNPALQQQVDSLAKDLATNTSHSSTDLIRADQSGACTRTSRPTFTTRSRRATSP